MKRKLLVFVMSAFVVGAFGQRMLLDTMNADFESGHTDHWRAVEVRDGAAYFFNDTDQGDALSSVAMTDNSNSGDYAAEITWAVDPTIVEIVFDYWDSPMPCEAETDYIMKASAMASAGAGNILRMNMTFFDGDSGLINGVIVGDYADVSWIIGDFYEEHVWTQPSPAGAKSVIIGFRVFNADGSRWPAEEVVTVLDDIQLWEGVDATAVNEKSLSQGVTLYPNPVDDKFQIVSDAAVNGIKIFNISGQLVKKVTENFDGVNVEELSSGLYIVKVDTELGSISQKMLKK